MIYGIIAIIVGLTLCSLLVCTRISEKIIENHFWFFVISLFLSLIIAGAGVFSSITHYFFIKDNKIISEIKNSKIISCEYNKKYNSLSLRTANKNGDIDNVDLQPDINKTVVIKENINLNDCINIDVNIYNKTWYQKIFPGIKWDIKIPYTHNINEINNININYN